jgi:uncharacterized membrane protein YgcG
LEVVLALAILVGAMAVLGELLSLGGRHAREAAESATAQILCESKLAEIVAGILPPTAVATTPCESDPEWQYSVTVDSTSETGLLSVRVTVIEAAVSVHPVEYSMTRWLLDPNYVAEKQAELDAASTSSSSTSSSSSSSGSPSSSGSGSSGAGS